MLYHKYHIFLLSLQLFYINFSLFSESLALSKALHYFSFSILKFPLFLEYDFNQTIQLNPIPHLSYLKYFYLLLQFFSNSDHGKHKDFPLCSQKHQTLSYLLLFYEHFLLLLKYFLYKPAFNFHINIIYEQLFQHPLFQIF